MHNSPTFCAMPFISTMLNTDGKMRYCCIASGPTAFARNTDGSPMIVGKNSVEEAWNSEVFKNARKDMLEGRQVEACKHCYKQESIGLDSYRTRMTAEWQNRLGPKLFDFIESAEQNNYEVKLPPVYLDLRLGNLCNLKCRMCNPFNSSQIAKEHFGSYETSEEYKEFWNNNWGPNPTFLKDSDLNFDSNFLWNEIIGLIPNLGKVYMTGGEPTLINNNYRFMEEIIAAGYQDKIEIFFNINCTNVTNKFLDLISKFSNIKINCSLDGFEKVNDYIRSPSKWEKIDENFQKIAQLKNVNLDVTPVVQTYNVLDCHNMLYYVESISKKYDRPIGIDFLINDHPYYLDVTILPEHIREKAAHNLEKYQGELLNEPRIQNTVQGIINLMRKDRHADHEVLMKTFINYTKMLDKTRKESFVESLPELAEDLNFE